MTTREEVNALRVLANQNITKILDMLRVDYEERYQYIVAPCPIHGGDNKSAFSWHLDLGMYQCFSRGCHEQYGKDVYGLIMGVQECKFPEAFAYVKNVYSKDAPIDVRVINQQLSNKKFVEEQVKKEKVVYPESILEKLTYHEYAEKRGYPRTLIQSYQAGVSGNKYHRMSNRLIFPVRDINGSIVGFTGRTLLDNYKDLGIGKWEHSKGFSKSDNLFNIDRAVQYIGETGCAIVTEGPLDVLRLEQAGIHNGVGIFGRKLHNKQISILMEAGASKLIIALDADNAGKSGAEDAMRTAKAFFDIEFVDLGSGDVGDLSVEKAKEIFKKEISYV